MTAAIKPIFPRIAVLVDADNVRSSEIQFAAGRIAIQGRVVLKRAFGRLTSIRAHEQVLAELSFSAEVALPQVGSGKNAADLLLAQYATRLAERQAVDTVAIVSSDGDFAAVARGLTEAGVRVIGVGRLDTPGALREACALFIPFPAGAPESRPGPRCGISDADAARLGRVIDEALGIEGRARASLVGHKINPAFGGKYKQYFAVSTLSELIGRLDGYRLEGAGAAMQVVRVSAI